MSIATPATPAAGRIPGLRPLDLGGGVRIETPVYLAPMSGVTDLPFRRLARRLGTGMVVSEMIASQAMLRENRQTLKMAEVDGFGAPSAVQLAGCEPGGDGGCGAARPWTAAPPWWTSISAAR